MGNVSCIADIDNVQTDLNTIYQWSNSNNMCFNADKFECLCYGYSEELKQNTCYLSNNKCPIEVKTSVKDLGVLMSSTAEFSEHISSTALSANLKAGWVLRTFRTRYPVLMLALWKSLILPIIDYCCQLWSPSAVGQIQLLEDVQKSYINKIHGMSHLNYWEQLSRLKLFSLQRRRERYIILYVWKTIENIVPNFGINTRVNPRTGRFCVVPHVRSAAPARVQSLRFASLSINGPRLFNAMPKYIRNIHGCAANAFKTLLDNYLKSVPDEPKSNQTYLE